LEKSVGELSGAERYPPLIGHVQMMPRVHGVLPLNGFIEARSTTKWHGFGGDTAQ